MFAKKIAKVLINKSTYQHAFVGQELTTVQCRRQSTCRMTSKQLQANLLIGSMFYHIVPINSFIPI